MDRRIIGLVWIGGLLLMAAVYAIGPQNFLAECEAFIRAFGQFLDDLLTTLMWRAFEVHAGGGDCPLCGLPGAVGVGNATRPADGGMLLGVSIVFLLLVRTDWYDPGTKWLAAALVAAVAAAVTTRRLLHAQPPRDPANPWGFGRRRG